MNRKIGLIDVDGHNFPNLVYTRLQRWCNNRYIFAKVLKFSDYENNISKKVHT